MERIPKQINKTQFSYPICKCQDPIPNKYHNGHCTRCLAVLHHKSFADLSQKKHQRSFYGSSPHRIFQTVHKKSLDRFSARNSWKSNYMNNFSPAQSPQGPLSRPRSPIEHQNQGNLKINDLLKKIRVKSSLEQRQQGFEAYYTNRVRGASPYSVSTVATERSPRVQQSQHLSYGSGETLMPLINDNKSLYQRQKIVEYKSSDLQLDFICKGHKNSVNGFEIINNEIWSVGSDYNIIQWQNKRNNFTNVVWRNGNILNPLAIYRGSKRFVNQIECIENSIFATAGNDKLIKIWRSDNFLTFCGQMPGHSGIVHCIKAASPRTLISGSGDTSVQIWDLESLKRVHNGYHEHQKPVKCIELKNPSIFFTGSEDCCIKLWDIRSFRSIANFVGHTEKVNCMQIWDEYTFLTGSDDTLIQKWDIRTGGMLQKLQNQSQVSQLLKINGKIVTSDSIIRVWDGNDYSETNYHKGKVKQLRFLEDKNILISCSMDCSIIGWNVKF